jgi:asparagine synthase (glutamine-hydrolysing)
MARLGVGRTLSVSDEHVLRRMLATLAHRGPDETNIAIRGGVGMAFTRLSLIGVDSGAQPLLSRDGTVALMANGEVYNHAELAKALPDHQPTTRSDCEVLVPLYQKHGRQFLAEVRGILAIVIHDAARNQLVFAVDPFANKPMFFTIVGDLLVFGSEIKSLFDHPEVRPRIDWQSALTDQGFASYPALTTAPVNTWFEGVSKVAAGTVVTVDLATGALSISQYWQPEFAPAEDPSLVAGEPADFVAAYRDLLFSSVEDSLASEAGLGLFLSGGIDSAAIAAIASALGCSLATFTVATEATILNGDVAASVAVARHLGIEHTIASLTTADVPSVEDWLRFLWLMESPLAGPEQYYKFSLHRVAKQRYPNLKAMLLGAGADEFNGGYSHALSHGRGWPAFEANLGTLACASREPAARWWGSSPQRRLLRTGVVTELPEHDPYAAYVSWKYRDVQQYNCWLEDRCAAGNGIEARVPFLDSRLVDLSTRVPPSLRRTLLWDKAMTRNAMHGLLPEGIRLREKKPFYDGKTARFAHQTVRALLRQADGALLAQALSGPRMRDYVDPDAVRASVFSATHDVHPEVLLRLVNLGLLDLAAGGERRPFHADQVVLRATVGKESDLAVTFGGLSPSRSTVLRFGADTRLAQDAACATDWLLLSANRVAFTIDETEVPDWVGFLLGIDGATPIGDIADSVGVDWQNLRAYIELCLERGYLEPAPAGLPGA